MHLKLMKLRILDSIKLGFQFLSYQFLRGVFLKKNQLLDLQNEAKTMQQKIKETEQDYRAVSDLLSNQRKLVIEAEMRLEMVTQELQSIKQQCEVLKIRNVDHLTSNEGLDTLKQFSKAWNTGLSGRQQKINFDQILKDVLGNYTVDSLLNDRHEKISVFDPLREKRFVIFLL